MHKQNKHIISYYLPLILIAAMLSLSVKSQLIINTAVSKEDLVNNLVGQGLTIKNITFTGVPIQRGIFSGNSNIGIKSGIILTTGRAIDAIGPNDDLGYNCKGNYSNYGCQMPTPPYTSYGSYSVLNSPGDEDIKNLLGGQTETKDAAVLEFDFIPESSPLEFNYVFASEEYPEWVCSTFNDIFAFLLSGPKPGGGTYNKQNIAIIPGTNTQVAINSINPGQAGINPQDLLSFDPLDCISLKFAHLYVNNGDGSTPQNNKLVQYDGYTKVLTAKIDVIPCKTYHIKLVIADVIDDRFDSAVFLEENSFKSNEAFVVPYYTRPDVDTVAIEGCSDAKICFTISKPLTTDFTIPLTYSGTATNGVDFIKLPDNIVIKKGKTDTCLFISPFMDGITEGTEYLIISAKTSQCGSKDFRLSIKDNSQLKATPDPASVSICEGASVNLSVSASGGISTKAYSYAWSNNLGDKATATVKPNVSTTYTVTVKDACDAIAIAKIEVKVNPNPILVLSKDTSICLGSSATLKASGAGTGGTYKWNNSKTTQNITETPAVVGTTTYTVTATTSAGCSAVAQVKLTVNPVPSISASSKKNNLCAGEQVELVGAGANTYLWSSAPNDPSLIGKEKLSNPIVAPLATTTYTVIGTNQFGCSGTASVVVNVKSPPIAPLKDTNICIGGSAKLEVKVAASDITYNWSNGANTAAINVNPNVTTTYTVTITENTFGCKTTISAVVYVHSLPVPAIAPPVAAICLGASIELSASGGGAGGKYLWSTGQTIPTITINPISTTKYYVTVTNSYTCSAKDSITVTVNPNPTVNAGKDTAICFGFTAPLKAISPQQVSYKWSSGEPVADITVKPSQTTTYTVTVTDANKCSAIDQVIVIVNPNPIPKGESKEICEGFGTNLNVTGAGNNGTYLWNNGETSPGISIPPYTVSKDSVITFSVTLTDVKGCIGDTTFTLTIYNNPTAVLPPDFYICQGVPAQVSAQGAGPGGSYNWSSGEKTPTITVNPPVTTTYIVTVTDVHSCIDKDTIIIEVKINPKANAGLDTAICFGFQATLHGAGAPEYKWSNGETSSIIYVSPQQTTNYTLTVTDAFGCIGIDSVLVTVNPIPTATFIIEPQPICIKQKTTLTYTGTGTTGSIFQWNIDGDTTKTGSGPFVLSWDSIGKKLITLTVIDKKCISPVFTGSIQVNPLPIANFYSLKTEGCEPLTVMFTDSSLKTNNTSRYLWNFGDGDTSRLKNPIHTYNKAGLYNVKLTVSNAAVDCDDIKIKNAFVNVWPNPVAKFYVQPGNIVSELEPSVTFFDNSIGKIISFKWTLDNSDSSYSDSTFSYTYPGPGVYTISLVVTNNFGCSDSTIGKIIVKPDFSIFVPNAFAPVKYKNPENSYFKAYGTNISSFSMRIYNRWGAMLFESNDINQGWDGKVNGVIAKQDIYIYNINYKDILFKEHSITGSFTLIK